MALCFHCHKEVNDELLEPCFDCGEEICEECFGEEK
jgi:hypothetical protein